MPITPRSHQPGTSKIHTPAAAVGDQELDHADERRVTSDDLAGTRIVAAPEPASSTEDGADIGRETGELYGQGIAPTGDVDADGVRAMQDYDEDQGETWTEALITSAATSGPRGSAPLDDVRGTEAEEGSDEGEDRPPADHGAGGPAGL